MRANRKIPLLIVALTILVATQVRAENLGQLKAAGLMHAKGKSGEEIIIPLKKTRAVMEVSASLMEVKVQQEFSNKNKFPLEAVYVFPLPANATVTNYQIVYSDMVLKSVVKERNEAKFEYEKAKSEGKQTALLEEERPNIFTTSVANLRPGETVQVEITFLQPLEYRYTGYEILFPTVVGPRYIPVRYGIDAQGNLIGKALVEDAHRITPPLVPEGMDPNYELEIQVSVNGLPFRSIESPTHPINIKQSGKKGTLVELKGKQIPNSDFVLKLELEQADQPNFSSVQHRAGSKNYGLLNIFPPKKTEKAAPVAREVLFLIDTSGSMAGTSIVEAREGLKKCLYSLKETDFFNIVRFSSDYSTWSSEALVASKENLGKALYFVDQLVAEGGTEMQPALEHLLNMKKVSGTMRLVVFMTDGDVGNENSLLSLLNNKLEGARVFPFGIGSAPNEFLLRKMGEFGHGITHFIHETSEVGSVFSGFFATLESPVLTDVEVEWLDQAGRPVKSVASFPKRIPDLYQDLPVNLYFEEDAGQSASVRIKGKIEGKSIEYSHALINGPQGNAGIQTLFGRAEIDELLYQYNFGKSAGEESLKKAVLEKALAYQLVTPFTSRVAVAEKIVRREGDRLITVPAPTLLPKGWEYSGLVAGATEDWLYLGFGALFLVLSAACMKRAMQRKAAHESDRRHA